MDGRHKVARRGIVALRLGLGVIWALNLIYVIDPANRFFATFATTASAYGPTTLGGPGLASFVSVHSIVFAALIAGVTGFLAVSFLLGFGTRVACVVGFAFNLTLLLTQFGSISSLPGGTDVGPQPLYLASYVALFMGYGEGNLALDRWLSRLSQRRLSGSTPRTLASGSSNPTPSTANR